MHEERGFLSVATLNGCIYAMGGCQNQKKLKTAERYEPDTNQWTMIASMHKRRAEAGAATLHGKVSGIEVVEDLCHVGFVEKVVDKVNW